VTYWHFGARIAPKNAAKGRYCHEACAWTVKTVIRNVEAAGDVFLFVIVHQTKSNRMVISPLSREGFTHKGEPDICSVIHLADMFMSGFDLKKSNHQVRTPVILRANEFN